VFFFHVIQFLSVELLPKLKFFKENPRSIRIFPIVCNLATWRLRKRKELLKEIEKHGRLRAKAFPGRAAIILELLMLTEEHIIAVYEQPNSPKVGCYVPGTGIPILSDDELDVSDSAPIVNLAWHIHDEILSYLEKMGFQGSVLPIITKDDFLS